MNEIQTLQPQPWEGTSEFTELFAPRDEEDAVPNPFAIPPAWLEAWQEDADDKAAMEAAAAEAKDVEDLKAASAAADKADAAKAHAKSASKADGIIASLSAAIPKFFQHDAEKKSSGDVVSPFIGATASGVAQAGGDIFSKASKAVGDLLGSTSQQVGAGATKGALDQLPGALTGLGTQAGGILTGLITGASQTAQAQFKPLVGAAHQAVQPAIHEVVKTTLDEAKPGITEMARSASDAATKAAQERLKAGGTGLGVDTTTLVLGGAAVLGVLGLGAYLLTSGNKFGALGALGESSTEDLQKMLDKASWSRPSGKPAVRWLSEGEHATPKPKTESFADSGLGAGVAIVGGASALAILAGYLLKNGAFGAHKTASGATAYGAGASVSSPSGHISHRSGWRRDRDASGPAATPAAPALTLRSSPLHPFTLADTLGMPKELLHLDPAAILGSTPAQKDHDDFFAGYPIGHKAGANNCDAARLGKQGVVYMKDPKKSQPWDNGWMKGYYDGWTSEGCKAGIPGLKTSSGPGGEEIEEALEIDEEWSADVDASGRRRSRGPDSTWNYIFTHADGSTWIDQTPTPNSQVSVTDNLAPDTAKAAKAVKVERVRFPDNFKVVVWSADKGASGPPPAIGILPGLWNVLLPWQKDAALKYKATHPNFGSDYQEMIRVLAISPAQVQKANAQYKPFAAVDAIAAAQAASQTAQDPGSVYASTGGQGPISDDGSANT